MPGASHIQAQGTSKQPFVKKNAIRLTSPLQRTGKEYSRPEFSNEKVSLTFADRVMVCKYFTFVLSQRDFRFVALDTLSHSNAACAGDDSRLGSRLAKFSNRYPKHSVPASERTPKLHKRSADFVGLSFFHDLIDPHSNDSKGF